MDTVVGMGSELTSVGGTVSLGSSHGTLSLVELGRGNHLHGLFIIKMAEMLGCVRCDRSRRGMRVSYDACVVIVVGR